MEKRILKNAMDLEAEIQKHAPWTVDRDDGVYLVSHTLDVVMKKPVFRCPSSFFHSDIF